MLQKTDPCILEQSTLTIKAVTPGILKDVRTVQVTGLDASMDQEMLELLFENTKTGGGIIEHLTLDLAMNMATITFQDIDGLYIYRIRFKQLAASEQYFVIFKPLWNQQA
jgi:hypothetical protein